MSGLKELFSSVTNENENQSKNNNQQHQHGSLSPKSLLGIYIKKILLNFNQILFDGLVRLFNDIQSYLHHHLDYLENNINNNNSLSSPSSSSSFLSPIEEERFVYNEIIKITSLQGKQCPQDIEYRIRELKKQLPNVHRVHLVGLLNSLGHYDYNHSLEELHRYFDYCNSSSITINSTGINSNSTGNNGVVDNPITMSNNGLMLPYAVLNLVKLHYHFGHYEEAYMALREAIRVAQERGDHSCLALTEHWLHKFSHLSIFGVVEKSLLTPLLQSHSTREILNKSIHSADQLDMQSLSSLNYSSLSTQNLLFGNKQQQNQLQFSSSASIVWNDVFKPIQQGQILDSSRGSTSASILMASAWQVLGNHSLATYFSELALLPRSRDQSAPLLAGSGPSSTDKEQLISICKLALLESKNNHRKAIDILAKCFLAFPYHNLVNSLLSFTTLSILFDYTLSQKGNNTQPQQQQLNSKLELCIESLIGLLNRLTPLDSEIAGWPNILQTYERIAKYYIHRGMLEQSYRLLCSVIKVASENGFNCNTISFHLLLSDIFDRSAGFSHFHGLNHTHCALSLSSFYNRSPMIASSNIQLTKIYLENGQYTKALSLIYQTLPLNLLTTWTELKPLEIK
eukprot:gene2585-3202_t